MKLCWSKICSLDFIHVAVAILKMNLLEPDWPRELYSLNQGLTCWVPQGSAASIPLEAYQSVHRYCGLITPLENIGEKNEIASSGFVGINVDLIKFVCISGV